jgi:hypothetical protein
MPKKRDETSNPVQQRPLFPVVAEAPSELQPEYNELLVEYLSAFESSCASGNEPWHRSPQPRLHSEELSASSKPRRNRKAAARL